MNCKPGDIAYITHPTMVGHLVDVMYAAPVGCDYRLPDGQLALTERSDGVWVCESLGTPFPAKINSRGEIKDRSARYAAIHDRWLRPIRPDGIAETEVAELYKPAPAQPVTAGEPA